MLLQAQPSRPVIPSPIAVIPLSPNNLPAQIVGTPQTMQSFLLPDGSVVIPIQQSSSLVPGVVQTVQITPLQSSSGFSSPSVSPQPPVVVQSSNLRQPQQVVDMDQDFVQPPSCPIYPGHLSKRALKGDKRRKSIFYGMSSRNKRRILDVSTNVRTFLTKLESSRVQNEEQNKRKLRSSVVGSKPFKTGKTIAETRVSRDDFAKSGIGKYRHLIARVANQHP